MVAWSTVVVLLLAGVLCAACCVAIAQAFLRNRADRVSYRLAGMWAACFATLVAGSLVISDAFGVDGAAVFAALVCLASFPLCLLLGRWWRVREMAAAVAQFHLCRAASFDAPNADELTGWTASSEAACARVARDVDLTRREEDVLILLVEGLTFSQVADQLVVSLNTVKSHVRHIYAKMGVRGKQDLLEKMQVATPDAKRRKPTVASPLSPSARTSPLPRD